MSENFYTNIILKGDTLYLRAISNGKRIMEKIKYKPTLFVPTKKKTKFKTLTGTTVEPVKFNSIYQARDFIKNYEEQPDLVYGQERFQYCYLSDNYPGIIEWNQDKILTLSLDIEVASENVFPDPNQAEEEVLAITFKNYTTKKIMVWGIYDYNNTRDDVDYVHCDDEEELLREFVSFMESVQPDVITGWNTTFFDIPYLCLRIKKLFGNKFMQTLSPWRVVTEEHTSTFGRDITRYNIWGVANLDYLDLYKKFTYTDQESFTLDNIAFVELGTKKDPNPYDTFKEWYTKD